MATIRILIWDPRGQLTVTASKERDAARMAEDMLYRLKAAQRGAVSFWIETPSDGARRRLMAYLRDLAREIEGEARLRMLTPLDEEPGRLADP